MLVLVTGGAGSGKSAFAERLSEKLFSGVLTAEAPSLASGCSLRESAQDNQAQDGRMAARGGDFGTFFKKDDRAQYSHGSVCQGSFGASFKKEDLPQGGSESSFRGIYLATMEPFGEEASIRISRHRAQRRTLGFATVECYTGLSAAPVPENSCVLLEDLSNLLANEMFSPEGAMHVRKAGESHSGKTAHAEGTAAQSPVPEPLPETARGDAAVEAVRSGLSALEKKCRHLVIVSNEVFSGGSHYTDGTPLFLKNLAVLNRETAARAGLVVEVVCGIPNVLKGVLP